jgi:hypothetical protein
LRLANNAKEPVIVPLVALQFASIVKLTFVFILCIVGILGCIIPGLPGTPLNYAALLLVQWRLNTIQSSTLIIYGILTIVVLVLLVSKSVWEILMIQARRIYYLGIISFLGWMSVLLSNWLGGNGWTTAKCSHIFIVAQMSETGVLKHYLDKYCDEGPSIMCKYKDSLPEHAYGFIWPQDGILMKTGGWHNSDTLYGKIIKTVLTDPELLMHYTGSALKSTSYQLISLGVGDGIFPVDSSSTLAVELKNRYPTDYDALFSDNPQQTGSIAFSDLNEFYRKSAIVLFLASLISIYLIPRKNQFAWIALSFILVLSNAFATSVFANVLMRLNTRGFWILMVVCLFLVLKTISHKLMKEAQ